MKLDNQQLMEEFYNSIKEDFPGVDYEQLKEVCFGPWRFLKQEMESGLLPTIRFKYFGTFQVYPGRAKNILYNLKKKFEEGRISEEVYLKNTEITNNRIKFLEDAKNK